MRLLYRRGVPPAPADVWLLLLPQIPAKPTYFRVKVWRRLQAVGAVGLKGSVYVLPNTDAAREDFEWLRREIVRDGGEATICEARLVDGLRDDEVQAAFRQAREADYRAVAAAARTLGRGAGGGAGRARREAEVARLRRRLAEIGRIDFFGAPGREAAEGLVGALEARLRPAAGGERAAARSASIRDFQGRVWVTRTGVHVDRIASAWLIRRFIDPRARIKCVPGRGYRPAAREVRFDMFEAEFSHEGDRCTFEVLVARFGLDDRGLAPIAEIVHDIDLKDGKFGRPEVAGVDRLIAGIAMAHKEDAPRFAQGAAVFDGLYEFHRRKKA